jgi:hypothetical protein
MLERAARKTRFGTEVFFIVIGADYCELKKHSTFDKGNLHSDR